VPVEDEAVSAELEKSFRKQGITSHTGARVTAAQASADGVDVEIQLADGTAKKIRADYLLVATGRAPVTAGLNAEGVGLQIEKGYITVDPLFRTSVPGISAVGDRSPRRARTSAARARVVGRRIIAERIRQSRGRSTTTTHLAAPTAIREIGSVGRPRRKPGAASTCGSARFHSACWAAPRWRRKPTAS
jgi:dihydrolipoamide dehydrogenase